MQFSEFVERKVFAVLSGVTHPRYGYRPGVVFRVVGRAALLRSLRLSARWKCRILVERRSRIVVHGSGRIVAQSGSLLLLGFEADQRASSAITISDGGTLALDGTVSLLRGTSVIVGPVGQLTLANGLFVNEGSRIVCQHKMDIGADCIIGYGATGSDTDEHEVLDASAAKGRSYRDHEKVVGAVSLGDHVWIGSKAIILKGVAIGNDSVVAAGAVVTHDVGAGELVAGVPARPFRRDITWLP